MAAIDFFPLLGKTPSKEEIRRRREHLKTVTVVHPEFEKIWNELSDVHFYSHGSSKADSLFISGQSGVGKSTLLRTYVQQYPPEIKKTFTRVPVLYVRVPERARSPLPVVTEMLAALKDPLCAKNNLSVQTHRLRNYVEKCHIEMIIIDEFQDLIDRDTDNVLKSASNWIKLFAENVNIPVVLCGLPSSEKIFNMNEQLGSRYPNRVELPAFKYETENDKSGFREYLDAIDIELPFAERSYISDPDIASRIFYVSLGVSRPIKDLLQFATTFALESGADKLSLPYLSRGFQKLGSVRKKGINPFEPKVFNLVQALENETK